MIPRNKISSQHVVMWALDGKKSPSLKKDGGIHGSCKNSGSKKQNETNSPCTALLETQVHEGSQTPKEVREGAKKYKRYQGDESKEDRGGQESQILKKHLRR